MGHSIIAQGNCAYSTPPDWMLLSNRRDELAGLYTRAIRVTVMSTIVVH